MKTCVITVSIYRGKCREERRKKKFFRCLEIRGEILAQPLAVEMFNRMVPGMADNPMLAMAHQMTLVELIGAAPEARPLYEAVVTALNEVDRQAAGAEK